jgi:opacity protein-like surface antigen
MPSLVRLWRRDRFSIYAGGGLGFEHHRQYSRLRPIIGHDANGQPVLADDFQNTSSTGIDTTLLLSAGAIVSLTQTVVVRAGYSLLPGYIDENLP